MKKKNPNEIQNCNKSKDCPSNERMRSQVIQQFLIFLIIRIMFSIFENKEKKREKLGEMGRTVLKLRMSKVEVKETERNE